MTTETPADRPNPARLSRRSFALGLAGTPVAAAIGPAVTAPAARAEQPALAAPAAATTGRTGVFFDETTLWDADADPLENYHVHGLAVLADDTILVATEGRHQVCDAGPRDLLLRRSPDGGETWEPTQTLIASVDGESWGNPVFVVDRETGEVFCFYALSVRLPGNTTCSGDKGELYLISSTDQGRTWSEPRSLAGIFDRFPYQWALHSPGPGHGIQLDTGRLLLNCSHRRIILNTPTNERYYGVAPIYSDDHGATWHTTGEVEVSTAYPINEARMVQRSDGSVIVNGRAAAGGNRQRIVAVSRDRGLTWSAPALDGSTGTFNAVDASLLRYTGGPGSGEVDRVLFSRPDAPVRTNMTVSVSYDEAYSFRYSRVINEARSYYSELARLSDGTIVLVYGCDGDIPSFPLRVNVCRFSLDWLTRGRDSLGYGPRHVEQVLALADGGLSVSGGRLEAVTDPLARGGARAVFTPGGAGSHVEYAFDVDRPFSYELLLRYHRPASGGLVAVTVDGRPAPVTSVIDTTQERAPGYDIAYLGTAGLARGRHTVRFTLAGPGRGGGTLISLDTLSLIQAPSEPDVRNEVLVDNDEAGYQVVSGTWSPASGVTGYYSGNYRSALAGTGQAVVRWRPVVPHDGDYRVEVSCTAHDNRATNAPYTVTHAQGADTVRIDQRVPGITEPRGGSWRVLGSYRLKAGLATTIELSNDADGFVIADAVRLIRLG